MTRCDNSLPALRRKLATAERKLLKLKNKRPLPPEKRNSDRHCAAYMQDVYAQMEKINHLEEQIIKAEKNRWKRKKCK